MVSSAVHSVVLLPKCTSPMAALCQKYTYRVSQEAFYAILTASAYSIFPSIAGGLGFSFIMSPTCDNHHDIIFHHIDNSVFSVNPAAPKTTQIFLQWLWFTDTLKGISPYIFYQQIDTFYDRFIRPLPFTIFFPCVIIPLYMLYLHNTPYSSISPCSANFNRPAL